MQIYISFYMLLAYYCHHHNKLLIYFRCPCVNYFNNETIVGQLPMDNNPRITTTQTITPRKITPRAITLLGEKITPGQLPLGQ